MEYKCRCKCTTGCKFEHLNYTKCKCKPARNCRCNIKSGCVYLIGCKDKAVKKHYIGEAIDPFKRFQNHITGAFSDFARMGKDDNRLEQAIRMSGDSACKKWYIIVLQDVPREPDETDKEWKQRRGDEEKTWMHRFDSHWPKGFNSIHQRAGTQGLKHLRHLHFSDERPNQLIRGTHKRNRTEDTRSVDTEIVDSLAKQAKRNQYTTNDNQNTNENQNTNNNDTNANACEPELRQVKDYIAEVMASFDIPQPEDATDGIPFRFTEGMMDIAENDLLSAIKSHVKTHTFDQEQLTHWSMTALYKTIQLVTTNQHANNTNYRTMGAVGGEHMFA